MKLIPKPTRIQPAFADREQICAMFERYAPYQAVAAYAPEGVVDETSEQAKRPVFPWFRGNWAVGGKPLVEGAEAILHNRSFLDAARSSFDTSLVWPEMVVVNINAPMPASPTHIDNPSFYGATRENYPLPFLRVMGGSGLFETWRVVRASTISWFYEDKAATSMTGRRALMVLRPTSNRRSAMLLFAETMIGCTTVSVPLEIGTEEMPRMSASAKIQPDGEGNWIILDNGEVRATYPSHAIRFSVLWKAEVGNGNPRLDHLTLDRIMEIFTADLRHRNVDFQEPSDPLADTAWILLLQRIYSDPTAAIGG